MKALDLERLWAVCNTLSLKESELQEQDIFISFMKNQSHYVEMSFEGFLNYYSFKVTDDEIIVFNDDPIAWENFTNNDYSYIPIILLSFDEWQLENWMKNEIDLQLQKQERDKLVEKDNLRAQIKRLETQLNNL